MLIRRCTDVLVGNVMVAMRRIGHLAGDVFKRGRIVFEVVL